MQYVNYLHELKDHLDLDRLPIPKQVAEHDKKLVSRWFGNKPEAGTGGGGGTEAQMSPGCQFGASLEWIREHNPESFIPPVVRKCVEYLSKAESLETEGIFRRSANALLIKELKARVNAGEHRFDFDDPHVAAVLLKTFLRELKEPILTFELFGQVVTFQSELKRFIQCEAIIGVDLSALLCSGLTAIS